MSLCFKSFRVKNCTGVSQGLPFILLVAVGADYNLLLISRIRDESPHGMRIGVIRTVASTGGVITSAGLIFAASMLGLMFASITTMLQAGFVIGVGILLDTFLVRTVTVPAMAVMVGRANWWPYRWWPAAWSQRRGARRAKRHRRRDSDPVVEEVYPDLSETVNGHHNTRRGKSHDEDDIASIATQDDQSDTATDILDDMTEYKCRPTPNYSDTLRCADEVCPCCPWNPGRCRALRSGWSGATAPRP